MSNTTIKVINGPDVSTVVTKQNDEVTVVHVYHNQPKEVKTNDRTSN